MNALAASTAVTLWLLGAVGAALVLHAFYALAIVIYGFVRGE